MLLVKRKNKGLSSLYENSLIVTEIPVGKTTYTSKDGETFNSSNGGSISIKSLFISYSFQGVLQIREYKDLNTGIHWKKKLVVVKPKEKYEVRFNPW